MKIVIVEDEPKTREGLIGIINKYTNYEVSGIANNGMDGIDVIKKLEPDLIISDIQMPEMDGLTMLQKLEEEGTKRNTLILTGYSDFEYARTALHLGVLDYILKPIDVESFIKILSMTEHRIRKEKIEKVSVEQLVWTLMTCKQDKKVQIMEQLCDVLHVNENVTNSLFLVKPDSIDKETVTGMMYCIETLLTSLCMENYHVIQLSIDYGIFVLLIDTEKNKHSKCLFQTYILPKLNLICGCSCSYTSSLGLSNLDQRIIDLKDLVNSSFIYNRGVIMEQSMIEQFKSSVIEYPFGLENRIRKEIINGNYKRAEEIGEQFRKLIIESNSSPKYIREYTARFSSSIYNVAKEYMPELETKSTFHYFINNIIESKSKQELINNYEKILYAVLDYNDTQMEINNKIVQKAINFIRNNYHRDITLSETAELVGVTPEYLSKLFYQEMNINFVVFLKNFRISVAKRLLLQENFRIQDIAEHVGFKDPKYFNKVFKSVCGVTPSEYKKVI